MVNSYVPLEKSIILGICSKIDTLMTIECETRIFGLTMSRKPWKIGQEVTLSDGISKAIVASDDEIRIPGGNIISTHRTLRIATVLTKEAINSRHLRVVKSNTLPARIASLVVTKEVHWRRG